MACKHGDSACGVYYDCGRCTRERHERIWRNMTPAQRAYDRHVDPKGAFTSGISIPGGDSFMWQSQEPQGCSCHISPPCSYCTQESET